MATVNTKAMDVYLIVGDANSRKSASIRNLTGAGREKTDWELIFTSKKTQTGIVILTSPQEEKGGGQSPAQFISHLKTLIKQSKKKSDFLIAPLRFKSTKNQPSYTAYITALINAGWNIQPVIMFNHPHNGQPNIPTHSIAQKTQTPSNLIASNIRGYWNII